MPKKQSVYVVGNPGMVYRLSAILMALSSEKFEGNVNYCSFYSGKKWKKIISRPFDWLVVVIHIIFCDTIFVVGASHQSKKGRFAIGLGKIFLKRIIVDFYISHYEARIIDRKWYDEKSKCAKLLFKRDRSAILLSNKTIFLSHAEAKYYCDCLSIDLQKINYSILPIINDKTYTRSKLPWHHGLVEMPTFAWWGRGIDNPIHGLDCLIEQFAQSTKLGKLILCVDGEYEKKNLLKNKPYLKTSKSIKIKTDLNFSDGSLPKYLSENIDYAIGPLGGTVKTQKVLANKVVDAVLLGLPVYTVFSDSMNEVLGSDITKYFIQAAHNKKGLENSKIVRIDVLDYQNKCQNIYDSKLSLVKFTVNVRSIVTLCK